MNIINTPDGPILKYSDFHAQQDVTVLIPATLESTVSTEIYSIIEQIFTKGNF